MDKLPSSILEKILSMLCSRDKVKCRSVCKTFKMIIDNQKKTHLAIVRHLPYRRPYFLYVWFDDLSFIDENDLELLNDNLLILDSKFFSGSHFADLKKLYIDFSYKKPDFSEEERGLGSYLDVVQNFRESLVTLDINMSSLGLASRTRIVMPNLQNLYFFSRIGEPFELDAPKLQFISCTTFEKLELVHPQSVIKLKTTIGSVFDKNFEFKRQFINLQFLDYNMLSSKNVHTLIDFIENLHDFKALYMKVSFQNENLDLNELKSLEQVKSKFPDSEIYANGLPIEFIDSLTTKKMDMHLAVFDTTKIPVFFANYHRLHNELPYTSIDYDETELLAPFGKLPSDIGKKFARIVTVRVNKKIIDPSLFANFLMSLHLIRKLVIKNSSLSTFYSEIPNLAPYVKILKIEDDEDVVNAIDFDFILKLKCLDYLSTNRQFDLLTIRKFMMQMHALQTIHFKWSENHEFLSVRKSPSAYRKEGNYVQPINSNHLNYEQLNLFVRDLEQDYNQLHHIEEENHFYIGYPK